MLLQQITPSMSKKMMRKGGGASAMSGTRAPPSRRRAASCYLWRCLVKVALQLRGACKSVPERETTFRQDAARLEAGRNQYSGTNAQISFGLGWVGQAHSLTYHCVRALVSFIVQT